MNPHYKRRKRSYSQNMEKAPLSPLLFDNKYKAELQDENTCWLDTNEAANFLRVSPNALRILVHRAQVKYYKFGSRLRFKVNDLNGLHHRMEV